MNHPEFEPFRVPFDGSFRISAAPTSPLATDEDLNADLRSSIEEMQGLQALLSAQDRWSLLLIFQAMDAAGKDGTIRAVMSGVNPAGCRVHSFQQPSRQELDHDFLWRTAVRAPERGMIGIFNRSWYEEVLVVRVHPELLHHQRLPRQPGSLEVLWEERFESIRDYERHLARNGTVILKFWLNVSQDEQRRRFLSRLRRPEKHWKFSSADVAERAHWDRYMHAYEAALNATSRPWAPWYALPADDKGAMRAQVARTIVATLRGLEMHYPVPSEAERRRLDEALLQLEAEET